MMLKYKQGQTDLSLTEMVNLMLRYKTGEIPCSGKLIVTNVTDGDTLILNNGGIVRLLGINTPERNEYYYSEATDRLKELVYGKAVNLIMDDAAPDRDAYGRLLRYVYYGDNFVNQVLLEEGYARNYPYDQNLEYKDLFFLLEQEAKENCVGIWHDLCEGSGYICSSNVYDCNDFSNHAEAQYVYDLCGGLGNDIHRLDRDGDGLACESPP